MANGSSDAALEENKLCTVGQDDGKTSASQVPNLGLVAPAFRVCSAFWVAGPENGRKQYLSWSQK
ncbi:hypothetical protein PoMZ_12735 [Pyricularia oryzae]|uniref:Uncharacterized protein n=1 Tax=Pyricularia oryzae TaxID=318829 RepID=A0A4P7NTI1_PYROR|nr:hypothetical protein PoMZ_12735 [Pyricularia oryzae]